MDIEDVILRARGGDAAALSDLFVWTMGRLSPWAMLMQRGDRVDLEDALQETCLSLFAHLRLDLSRIPDNAEGLLALARWWFKNRGIDLARKEYGSKEARRPGLVPLPESFEVHLTTGTHSAFRAQDQVDQLIERVKDDRYRAILRLWRDPSYDAESLKQAILQMTKRKEKSHPGSATRLLNEAYNELRRLIEIDNGHGDGRRADHGGPEPDRPHSAQA